MKYTLFVFALGLALLSTSCAAGTLQLDFSRAPSVGRGNPTLDRLYQKHRISKRAVASTVGELLDNEFYLYFANVSVGTPGQHLRLQIDTGSSDIWFQSAQNKICGEASDPCAESGIYNPNDSSTYHELYDDFSIRYGDYSYAKGDYASEYFTIGGETVTNLTVAIAIDANATQGIMGIGYDTNEAVVFNVGPSRRYKNLPDLLVSQNHIASRAYSLWLNDQEASTGSVLFGGIDRAKYNGTLATLPFISDDGESTPSEFFVKLDGYGYSDADGTETSIDSSLKLAVLLDSGTSFIYLPPAVQSRIANASGASYNDDLGYYIIPCPEVANSAAFVEFYFDGVTINVPVSQIFVAATDANNNPINYNNGEQVCLLTVLDNTQIEVAILGDTFLRSAYVVYDLDNNQAGLAQSKYNATASDVVAIGTGPDAISDAVKIKSRTRAHRIDSRAPIDKSV
ncbi:aspartic peptidase domain-containing protein [Kockiozyma suomiensis]|uniref:aspartic peptidase domain-containing protein n=1 Tax=Kockiozyma suomiensis TaxID=1337062 RepID=UPI0033442377